METRIALERLRYVINAHVPATVEEAARCVLQGSEVPHAIGKAAYACFNVMTGGTSERPPLAGTVQAEPTLRVEGLRCLTRALYVSVADKEARFPYYDMLLYAAQLLCTMRHYTGFNYERLTVQGVEVQMPRLSLPDCGALCLELLAGVDHCCAALVKLPGSDGLEADERLTAYRYRHSLRQGAFAMAFLLHWLRDLQVRVEAADWRAGFIAFAFQEGTSVIMLESLQPAGPQPVFIADLLEQVKKVKLIAVVMLEIHSEDGRMGELVLPACFDVLLRAAKLGRQRRAPNSLGSLTGDVLAVLSEVCGLALAVKAHAAPKLLRALLKAWQPFRTLPELQASDGQQQRSAEIRVRRVIKALETRLREQTEAASRAPRKPAAWQADAAMQALLAEEEGAAQEATTKKAKQKRGKQAKKGASASQGQAAELRSEAAAPVARSSSAAAPEQASLAGQLGLLPVGSGQLEDSAAAAAKQPTPPAAAPPPQAAGQPGESRHEQLGKVGT